MKTYFINNVPCFKSALEEINLNLSFVVSLLLELLILFNLKFHIGFQVNFEGTSSEYSMHYLHYSTLTTFFILVQNTLKNKTEGRTCKIKEKKKITKNKILQHSYIHPLLVQFNFLQIEKAT